MSLSLLGVAHGCSNVLGLEAYRRNETVDRTEPEGGLPADAGVASGRCLGSPFRSEACAACVDGACCTEASACATDSACRVFAECLALCAPGNPDCKHDCIARSSRTAFLSPETGALTTCMLTQCASECPIAPEADGGTCGGWTEPTCDQCCCAESGACAADPNCERVEACAEVCRYAQAQISQNDQVLVATNSDRCLADCYGATPPTDTMNRWLAAHLCGGLYDPPLGTLGCGGACEAHGNTSCYGHVVKPAASSTGSQGPFHLYASLTEELTGEIIRDVTVRLCPANDPACASVLGEQYLPADGDGLARFDLQPARFSGENDVYVWFSGNSDYWPFIAYTTVPITRTRGLFFTMYLRHPEIETIMDQVQLGPTPDTGGIAVAVDDCERRMAADVQLRVKDPGAKVVYFQNGTKPDLAATATDASGIVSVARVTPGIIQLDWYHQPTGVQIGTAQVPVMAGTITGLELRPTAW